MHDVAETLVRVDGVGGELVVRRRRSDHDVVYELIINGAFAMDTAETSTEQLLAAALLQHHRSPRRVLVAGLGFGFTVRELLADSRVEHVDVVELEPELVRLVRAGIVPDAQEVVADPRVQVVTDDVLAMLPTVQPGTYDGILFDVDNGPDFLIHAANAQVYEADATSAAARALRPGGVVAVWSSTPSPALSSTLSATVGPVDHIMRTVRREGRDVDYHIYVAVRK
ncbi:hypothetical protein [Haloactinopolyspora sp.]|uniref:spermine/spermidine synthase domain-containing protein n=1 Tax=Haloactinopolyspora sp. TaxID=1966353 RepID=UPI002627CE3B|nr:hypothetical protein [Haloactinopolyspora sp.]